MWSVSFANRMLLDLFKDFFKQDDSIAKYALACIDSLPER